MTAELPAATAAAPALEDCSAVELHEWQALHAMDQPVSSHAAATSSTGEVGGRRRRLDARFIVDPCGLKEEVMQSVKFEPLSSRAKVAGAVFALVLSLASLSFVVVLFASASGELDPLVAKLNSEASSHTVAAKQRPAKPAPG